MEGQTVMKSKAWAGLLSQSSDRERLIFFNEEWMHRKEVLVIGIIHTLILTNSSCCIKGHKSLKVLALNMLWNPEGLRIYKQKCNLIQYRPRISEVAVVQ